jgi:16S rRNA U1498 N3-methylase RsmE
MRRFFIDPQLLTEEQIRLPEEILRHLRVLRLQPGMEIELLDGAGLSCSCELLELDRRRGALVSADEVRLGAFNMARKARDQLIALPERVSATLAAIDDPVEVGRILDEEIERICQEIADAEQP